MNVVILFGRLTRDPEVKRLENDKIVARFNLAVNDYKSETDFINCIAWGRTAELMEKYFKKGNQIALRGKIQVRKYEKDGENRTVTEVLTERIDFIEKKQSTEDTESDGEFITIEENDDLPF